MADPHPDQRPRPRPRPTLRCLRGDLKLHLPPADQPLDELDHLVLHKALEQFADPNTPHERILAVDDQVLFKLKIQRWRGAVWTDRPDAEPRVWVVAAGHRASGSTPDFYAALAADAQAARSRYNATHTPPLTTNSYTKHLLPTDPDLARFQAEAATRFERALATAVRNLTRGQGKDADTLRKELHRLAMLLHRWLAGSRDRLPALVTVLLQRTV